METATINERYITIPDARRRLSCTAETVRRWVREGRIRGKQLPTGRWLVREADVDSMLVGA